MKYVKAQDVLPEEILEILQKYIDGKYLYVPKKRTLINLGEKIQELKEN